MRNEPPWAWSYCWAVFAVSTEFSAVGLLETASYLPLEVCAWGGQDGTGVGLLGGVLGLTQYVDCDSEVFVLYYQFYWYRSKSDGIDILRIYAHFFCVYIGLLYLCSING